MPLRCDAAGELAMPRAGWACTPVNKLSSTGLDRWVMFSSCCFPLPPTCVQAASPSRITSSLCDGFLDEIFGVASARNEFARVLVVDFDFLHSKKS